MRSRDEAPLRPTATPGPSQIVNSFFVLFVRFAPFVPALV